MSIKNELEFKVQVMTDIINNGQQTIGTLEMLQLAEYIGRSTLLLDVMEEPDDVDEIIAMQMSGNDRLIKQILDNIDN